jgi:hypothetical protein
MSVASINEREDMRVICLRDERVIWLCCKTPLFAVVENS